MRDSSRSCPRPRQAPYAPLQVMSIRRGDRIGRRPGRVVDDNVRREREERKRALEANRKERTTKENEQLTLTALILGSFFETESHFEGAERFFLARTTWYLNAESPERLLAVFCERFQASFHRMTLASAIEQVSPRATVA